MAISNSNKKELIYNYIIEHTADKGYAPSIREICAQVGISSTSAVHYHIDNLRKEGRLQSSAGKSRSFTATTMGAYTNAPLVGNISAGTGNLAVEDIECYYPIPSELYGHDNIIMLKVVGNSMIDAGINDGDIVIVHRQSTAEVGEIVVFYWDGIATVKRLVSLSPLTLHPENTTMQDIYPQPTDDYQLIGKVVGCLKVY